ncbi:dienelactone hydrolase family protein [Amycolatopsis sp. Poz14]|uniref:dienelactone hydrolase family protein n=1 Tax=Amycolatopsis sp. Poz14 TaxID=1447705 RepID=UPI001EE7AF32|nr:dienelactone hydrolase family protein [Amycolatopsis sp. Poz14]MCG3749709.1 dienelactone hydrolase family protein [Amycolatopsis sp. Poz14]
MDIRIPVADGEIDGYLAVPSGDGPFPAVVLIHDIFGLNQDAREITDRYAAAGYLALSPDLYSRGGMIRCVKRTFQEMLAREGRAFADIEAARVLVAGRDDATGKVGVVGFCMGGGFALVAASREFDASAPYYGALPKDLSILDGACPIVGSFGGKDLSLRGAAAKLDAALTERGIPHDVKEYPDAGHGFANHYRPAPLAAVARVAGMGYHEPSDSDAWRRVMAFFGEHLK